MTIALLQPHFAPDLHDLALMLRADQVWLQTGETWSRKGRVHRARIRTPEGTAWLNLPVRTEDRDKPIDQVRLDPSVDWFTLFRKTLFYNYRNSFYFDFYQPEVEADLEEAAECERLLDAALLIRSRLFSYLNLNARLSDKERQTGRSLKPGEDPGAWAVGLGATRLWQEHDARHYQRQAENRADPEMVHPTYRQHFDGFEPWCCLLDLLFHYGPEARDVWGPLIEPETKE